MNKSTLILLTMILGIITILGYMAYIGSLLAVIALTIGITIIIFCAGAGLAICTIRIMQAKAQEDFYNNTQENLGIMQSMQKLQNMQNNQLLSQAKQLPNNGHFTIEDGIFDEL